MTLGDWDRYWPHAHGETELAQVLLLVVVCSVGALSILVRHAERFRHLLPPLVYLRVPGSGGLVLGLVVREVGA